MDADVEFDGYRCAGGSEGYAEDGYEDGGYAVDVVLVVDVAKVFRD